MNGKSRFQEVVSSITSIGYDWHCNDLVAHAMFNKKFSNQSIKALAKSEHKKGQSGIVISAGPSLHKFNVLQRVKAANFKGPLICVDGSYVKCLKSGLIPDYVLTLDPHPTRIVRWFGDSDFEENSKGDDYFSRQDLDVEFRKNTILQNQANIQLVNEHAQKTKLIICSSAPKNVVIRTQEAKFPAYWWNPLVDNPQSTDSLTRKLYNINKLPCMNTGGTVGTAAWVFASSILNISTIAVVGMDLGYHQETPIEMTQVYHELRQHASSREELLSLFPEFIFPLNGQKSYTDQTYFWYRKNFLELLEQSKAKTYNCSEAGTLFGPNIECITLSQFLETY